jgi:hypothetical protein
MREPRALLVSEDPGTLERWASWLETVGFEVSACPGPHVMWLCPRLEGSPCARRERADVAIVDLSSSDVGELYGGFAERVCTTVPDDGRTVFARFSGEPVDTRAIVLRAPVTEAELTDAALAAVSETRTPAHAPAT